MGQYVKRNGKTYYKADDGKLYTSYENAVSGANLNPFGRFVRNVSQGLDELAANPLSIPQKGFNELTYMANQIAAGQTPYANPTLGNKITQNQPIDIPAGTIQPDAIVSGLTKTGEVDRSQSDDYKAQMAQYRDLIAKKKEQEAEDLGMKIWMQKYGKSGLGLTGPNPLMQDMANAPSGFGTFTPSQGPTPAVLQASEAPMKAFGQEVKTFFPGAGPEGFNPLDAQDQQQQATADQADMATTVKLPVRNRVQAFLQGGM